MVWPAEKIQEQFPILQRRIFGKPLVYLDNAATTQKPLAVIEAITDYYQGHNANVHRGVHTLGDESTEIYRRSRKTIAHFFGAEPEELVFARNATEGLNLAAAMWAHTINAGDVIAASLLEHHSNFVPWQRVARERGANFVALPLLEDGRLDWHGTTALLDSFGDKLKVLALAHISNATGAVVPVEEILSHLNKKPWRSNVLVALDAAQSAARRAINFSQMGIDVLAFSGHKLYGPMGIGGLLVRQDRLNTVEPILVGGGMISRVSVEDTTYAEDLQERFAAGTPDVAGAAGLAAACDFLSDLGMGSVQQHDEDLVSYAYEQLSTVPEVEIIGPHPKNGRQGSVAFLYRDIHAHDVAQVLDRSAIEVRSGHHCTMPLHKHYGWQATTRASFGVYNTTAEIDQLVESLQDVKKVFTRG